MNNDVLQGIGFENFRVFKQKTLLDFAPLTVLTGTNGSGKSSVINALHLMKDCFREPELINIFFNKFQSGEMFKRYGHFGKFISFPSSEEKKSDFFKFSIPVHLINIDELAYIEYTITLQEHDSNSGSVTNFCIRLRSSNKIIFSVSPDTVYKGSPYEGYALNANIDLVFFYEKFLQFMAEQAIFYQAFYSIPVLRKNREKGTNIWSEDAIKYAKKLYKEGKLHGWSSQDIKRLEEGQIEELYKDGKLKRWSPEEVEKMESDVEALFVGDYKIFTQNYNANSRMHIPDWNIFNTDRLFLDIHSNDLLQNGEFYNFDTLWKDNNSDEALFQQAVTRFYGAYDRDTKRLMVHDIMQLLSEYKWNNFDSFVPFNENMKEKELDNAFSVGSYANRLRNNYTKNNEAGDVIPDTSYEKLDDNKIKELTDKKAFLEYLISVIHAKEGKKGGFELERLFLKELVTPNLNLSHNILLHFYSIEFISSERSNTKGIKSILDNDDLSRLTKRRFSATGYEKEAFNKLDEFLNKWLQEFKVADEIKFEKDEDYDTFKVKLLKNGMWMILSDEGFGISQVLPVILSCCPIINDLVDEQYGSMQKGNAPKLVLIEEPETNLHPALQSKLADMFMDAIKTFNIRFVIETHSEYLIRKLQYLTGKGDIKPEQTVIYYFYPPTEVPPGEKQVKKINIREDGGLTDDFGTGFFDEADNIALELFLLKQSQKN